ncbi:MAG: lysophospholipid acyltransferase family protein [Oceanococcaceae bacterium]
MILALLYGLLLTAIAATRSRPEPIAAHWFRVMLRSMGIRCRVEGQVLPEPVLLVGNHMSWVDILLVGGHAQTLFVSKDDVKGWPVVNWMCQAGKTLYIARGAHGTAELRQDMLQRFGEGHRVLIFPEGTTTSGPGVRRFQPRLFAVAIDGGIPVQTFALHYDKACVAYVDGGPSMVGVLWDCLGQSPIQARLCFGPQLPACEARDAYARSAQGWVEGQLQAFHHSPSA